MCKKTRSPAIMVTAALLVALSIICGKYLAIRGGDILRFSFENLPLLLAGMAFGPVVGALAAVAADLIGCLLVGYTINPIITLGGALIGFVGGVCYRCTPKLSVGVRVTIATTLAHLVGSVIVKTLGLAAFYDMPLLELAAWRLLNYFIIATVEGILLCCILKNKAIFSQLQRIKGE